ncbi:MAG: hypothetical protein A3F68_08275 [Acidobacteria bacterium RIFCSPLOWO2_12_FULL_54_10]|nr:MAG: hypothetical protein A3F68_08275 [Acidobacteria bacterium RIFCSPLOWO2_12_FULL_54_10]
MQLFDLIAVLPELILTLTAILVMLTGAFQAQETGRGTRTLALLGLASASVATLIQRRYPGPAFDGILLTDPFSIFFHFLFPLIAAFVLLSSSDYLRSERMPVSEYHALLLFAAAGMGLMASANDLILIFIGLEISSLSSYILIAFRRRSSEGSESSLKYFLLGSFATAFFLYGIALLFGATGSTRITAIREIILKAQNGLSDFYPGAGALAVPQSPFGVAPSLYSPELLALAAAMLFVGLGFKVSAAPFQIWTPDVYQGAPTPITAFLSTAPKAAAFAVFLRVFYVGLEGISDQWSAVLWVSAALTMLVGNLAALWQTNLKRMLAYSSIAHAGYMLVAFTAHTPEGASAVLFYLVVYAFMNLGALFVIMHIAHQGERYLELSDYAGLGFREPFLASCLSFFLLSLIGIPLTGGFFGKFYIFRAALHADLIGLTILAVLNSAVAAYYYLRIITSMYMSEPLQQIPLDPVPPSVAVTISLCAICTFVLGVFPTPILQFARYATLFLEQVP